MSDDLHDLSIAEAGRRIAAGALSPRDLTRALLARIDALDGRLHSFIRVTRERALAEADAAEAELRAGRRRGPLHGIPVAVKDVFASAGIPTTGGSRLFEDDVPGADAAALRRLADGGAILLGKLALHELTYGGVSFDLPWPPARNPWDLARDTGGSSTGAGAALAAGLCPGALGTDTGGSIRNPAGHCGVVGLKPGFGRVSRHGVIANAFTFDHCGPMARNVEDCAILLQAIAGHDPEDPASADLPVPDYRAALGRPIAGLRIGVVRHFYEADLPASAEIRAAIEAALAVLAGLGANIEEARLAPLDAYADCKATIQMAEIHALYEDALRDRPEAFTAKLRARIAPGAAVRAVDYVRAQERRRALIAAHDDLMTRYDALITAGVYGPAPLLDAVAAAPVTNRPEITVPFSVIGSPAISIPCGFGREGLPLSLQIAGRRFDEATVLRIAHAYEQATPWYRARPAL